MIFLRTRKCKCANINCQLFIEPWKQLFKSLIPHLKSIPPLSIYSLCQQNSPLLLILEGSQKGRITLCDGLAKIDTCADQMRLFFTWPKGLISSFKVLNYLFLYFLEKNHCYHEIRGDLKSEMESSRKSFQKILKEKEITNQGHTMSFLKRGNSRDYQIFQTFCKQADKQYFSNQDIQIYEFLLLENTMNR